MAYGTTIGDAATLAGYPLVAPTDSAQKGYEHHNKTRDLVAGLHNELPTSMHDLFPGAFGRFRAALNSRNERPVVLVFCGSSSTAGYGITLASERWVDQLVKNIHNAYPRNGLRLNPNLRTLAEAVATPPSGSGIHTVNAGVSGTTSASYIDATTRPQINALNPDVIFHQIGQNDWANERPVATFETNMRQQIADLDAAASRRITHILVHGHRQRTTGGEAGLKRWVDYGIALRRIAEESANVMFINLHDFWEANAVPGADFNNLMQADTYHMNTRGQALWADLVTMFLAIHPKPAAPRADGSAARVTSDSCKGSTAAISGRAADLFVGGTAAAWALDGTGPAFEVTTSGIQPTASGNGRPYLTLPNNSYQVHLLVAAVPDNTSQVYVDFNRAVGSSGDHYRLTFLQEGLRLQYRDEAGAATTLFDLPAPSVFVGKPIVFRRFRELSQMFIDGDEVWHEWAYRTGVGRTMQLARSSATDSAFTLERLAIDVLV